MYSRTHFERKVKEDEIGPTDWSNAAKSEVQCPKEGCDGTEAAFFQVQIRSADEPMTTFFKVCGPYFPSVHRFGAFILTVWPVYDLRRTMEGLMKLWRVAPTAGVRLEKHAGCRFWVKH